MWANAQRDGRPAEYRWRPLLNAAKLGWRPLLECRAVTLPTERKTWAQSEFRTWQNSVTGQQPPKIYSAPAQETAKHRARFGWLSLGDVAAVTMPKRVNPLKFAGVPQTNEPISAASGPKFTILWGHVGEILLFDQFSPIVDKCLSCEDIARQTVWWCADGEFLAIFCVLYFQRAACSTLRPTSQIRTKATPCVEVW